jgi:hypothetical protein
MACTPNEISIQVLQFAIHLKHVLILAVFNPKIITHGKPLLLHSVLSGTAPPTKHVPIFSALFSAAETISVQPHGRVFAAPVFCRLVR